MTRLNGLSRFVVVSVVILAFIVSSFRCYAGPRDANAIFELLKSGASLNPTKAQDLEQRLVKKPDNEEARIKLLAYYASEEQQKRPDIADAKVARAKHILWLIEKDPKTGLGLFQVSTGVYRLNCTGDALADASAFERSAELWMAQVKKFPGDPVVLGHAVDAIQYCSPERAEGLLTDAKENARLGSLYASAVLGITGHSYTKDEPAGTDPTYRNRPFSMKALGILESAASQDGVFLVSAARKVLSEGGILWAEGKLDWDYTPLGKALLALAKEKAPDEMLSLVTLPTVLPKRGERPPATIRVGGNVMASKLISQTKPSYPVAARMAGISGTVRMTAIVGLDGSILYLRPESGPSQDLVAASLDAVRQWRYRPVLLNGRPCYVMTLIDVYYVL